MRAMLIAGVLLIVLGVLSLAYQGITYVSDRDTLDLGPLEITSEEKETIPLPPIIGAIALAAGTVMTLSSLRKPVGG